MALLAFVPLLMQQYVSHNSHTTSSNFAVLQVCVAPCVALTTRIVHKMHLVSIYVYYVYGHACDQRPECT